MVDVSISTCPYPNLALLADFVPRRNFYGITVSMQFELYHRGILIPFQAQYITFLKFHSFHNGEIRIQDGTKGHTRSQKVTLLEIDNIFLQV